MNQWVIELTVESDDAEYMARLVQITRQYLEAGMAHTKRHDAKLIDMWLVRKEDPHAADNSAAEGHPGA